MTLNDTASPPLAARFRKARLNPVEASAYFAEAHGAQVAVATLAKMRSVGGGPAYLKFGRSVLYERAALDRWIADRLGPARASTSAPAAA